MVELYLPEQEDQSHVSVTLQSSEQYVNSIMADHVFLLFSRTLNNYGRKIMAIIYNIWKELLAPRQASKLEDYLKPFKAYRSRDAPPV